jgi:trimeric autotransporter adhesin
LLKDIRLGIENSLPRNFTKVGSQIYFEAHTDDGLTKVFKSNGTSQGTSLALNMSIYRSDFGSVEEFGNLSENINMLDMGNGILFFTVRTDNGYELYKTSGSASSTILLKSFGPYVHSAPRRFKNINGIVFFAATDNTNGEELWKSDGTVAGTVLVKDINPGSSGSSPNKITSVGNTIYFIATHPYYGRELWKSDGTSAGTVLVKDIYPGTYSDDYTVPINMTDLNGTLYFTVSDNVHGRELWKSDGTAAGTVLVKDIRTGSSPSMFPSSYMINAGGTLYFQAYTEATGYELWKSDGTSEGTVLVKDINPGSKDGFWSYSFFTWMNGFLYFQAQSTDYDLELWKTDGTTNGTVLVKDIAIGRGSGPEKFVNNNGILYFTAYDEESEKQQLWKSDGTNAGTVRVKNIDISIDKSGPTYLTAAFGKIYFGIANSYYERIFRLWQSDGTEAGTFEVSNELKLRDLSHFAGNDGELDNNSYKKVLIPSGERLYFFADNGKFGMELWSLFQPPCSTNLTLINPTDNIFDGNNLKQASAINGKIQASNHITGTAIVTYQAKTIELNPNFKAENGTVFKAEIGGCN